MRNQYIKILNIDIEILEKKNNVEKEEKINVYL